MAKSSRVNTRVHKLLGLVIGAQLLLWTVSGLFFTLIPIEQVRGEHLRAETHSVVVPDAAALGGLATLRATGETFEALELVTVLDAPMWRVTTEDGPLLFAAETGAARAAFSEDEVRAIAEAGWAGQGALASVALIDPAPREARHEGRAMWRAEFAGKDRATFWIDPRDGEIAAVRTQHWRLFDLFWGLHIMDWQGRETFSTWWMKAFAFGLLVLSLSGVWMLVERARQGRLWR